MTQVKYINSKDMAILKHFSKHLYYLFINIQYLKIKYMQNHRLEYITNIKHAYTKIYI